MAIEFNVDSQVRPYANLGAFPATGAVKTIYIAEDTNKTYRWTGSAYVEISPSPTQTSDLTNDGENGINPFITALDIPGSLPPSGTAGGDLTGTYPNPTVHRIHGIDMQNGTPSADETWVYGGSPAKWQHQHLNASQVNNDSSVTGTNVKLALNHLESTKVPTSRTLTINGTTQDLSADRTFNISTGITIGTTAITSGTVGRVLFEGTGNVVSESANLFWDNTNGRLGIGGTPGAYRLDVNGNIAVNNSIYVYSTAYASYTRALYDDGSLSTVVRGNTHLDFWSANNFRMRINNSGNVLINTTTDAGFKLDVNGTAVIRGITAITGNVTISNASNLSVSNGVIGIDSNVAENNSYGSFNFGVNQTGGYAWIQSYLSRPIVLNSLANNVIIGSTTNVASAILNVTSTTKGFLPPRMTTTQKNAIASPSAGLMVYDTTLNLMALYNGTTWTTL